MPVIHCENIIRKELGRKMDEQEIADFFKEGKQLYKQMMAGPRGAKLQQRMNAIANIWSQKQQFAAIAQKRATKLQLARRFRAAQYALTNFAGREGEGVSALLVGSKFSREGARMSVDALANSTMGQYIGGLIYDIKKLGNEHFALFRKRHLEENIAQFDFCFIWKLYKLSG